MGAVRRRDVFFQEKVDEALKAKRSVELGAMIASEAGAKGGLEAAMERVEPLQANVVDLSEMALGEGGADVAVVVAWMRSNPSGLTRLWTLTRRFFFLSGWARAVDRTASSIAPGSPSARLFPHVRELSLRACSCCLSCVRMMCSSTHRSLFCLAASL